VTQALVLKPGLLLALADLGGIYFEQGSYDPAIQYFKRAAASSQTTREFSSTSRGLPQ
jgi:tetratricopeptide (TPR) repeat protein